MSNDSTRSNATPVIVGPDTVLVRRRDIVVRLGDADDIVVDTGNERTEMPPHVLAVLDAFAHPRRVAEVLDGNAASVEHWVQLSSTVVQLARAGVLIVPGTSGTVGAARGFARPSIHIVMLDDERRTSAFIEALQALTRPDDVVVDIGTGTGILATSAVRAGARHVHAVESSDIAHVAERVFEENRVADRVTLVRGRSSRVSLAERGTLLVTEIIGNDPFDEHILETIHDAKDRLLTPDARLIPSHLEVVLVPVEIPQRTFERHVVTTARIDAWRAMYGVELSSLLSLRLTAGQSISVKTADFAAWSRVAQPVSLARIDFEKPFRLVLEERVSFELERDVERLGVVLAFRATLAPGIVLSTVDPEANPLNSWRYAMWPSIDRPAFARGATATVDYSYDRGSSTLRIS